MEILYVDCLNKRLGIAKGLKMDILSDGKSIGNILTVDSFTENKEGVVLYSEMLKRIFGKLRISDLVNGINSGEIEII